MRKHMGKITLAAAVGATLGGAAVITDANPFVLNDIGAGYMVGTAGPGARQPQQDKSEEGRCGEGRCGGAAEKEDEGSCGGDADKGTEGRCGGDKEIEGRCGEGKCGAA